MPTRRRLLQNLGAAATLSGVSSGEVDSQIQASNIKPREREWTWENIGRELKHSNQDPDEKVPVNEIEETLQTDDYESGSYVVADEDKLVVAEINRSNVEAWDRQTENKIWDFDEGTVSRPPAIGDDFFYFSGGDGTIYAVDDNGNKVGENKAISASDTLYVDNHVVTVGSTGEINLFDETLDNQATKLGPPDVNIGKEVATVDDQGRLIYVEARQSGSPNTSLRMLDLKDPSETDSLEEVASVNVASDANNGATLHNGNYIWSRENGELRVVEVENDGFGKLYSADIGSLDSAPVVVNGDVWAAVDESLYRVALDEVKSEGSVDPELVDDSFENQVDSVVATETEVVAGTEMDTTKVYDSETGDEVVELSDWENDVFRRAIAVFDGKLVTRSWNGSDYVYKVLEGDYREIGPDITGYSVEYSGIVGDSLTAEVTLADPASEVEYAWAIRDADGTPVQQSSGAPTWEVTPTLEVGETYEVAVEVTFQGVTERRATTITPAPPPLVGDTPPQDHDGDGRYEDIRGTGEATVMDTQALFMMLEAGDTYDYPRVFNFSHATPADEVTILDVAAHWRSHVAED